MSAFPLKSKEERVSKERVISCLKVLPIINSLKKGLKLIISFNNQEIFGDLIR